MKNYGVEPIKNCLNRMLFRDDKPVKKLYLITKEDGTQSYFRALSFELYVDDKEAIFYTDYQVTHGTIFTKVINVEEID